ncbi:MAG TPA: ribose 5-phosphate isomerase A [Gaiellaceae bacterium]|nr:ribose 5-phosphate isomerase A [Gaiellaceae bacterium]
MTAEDEKRIAAEAAAGLVEDGMALGLGTGTTVELFLPALARRRLRLRCVATSPRTEEAALALGLRVEPFHELDRLDLAVDGADQVAPDRWVVKGGGGAHTREKVVAAAAERFVVIVSSDKLVEALQPPVPVEIMVFGARATLARIAPAELRPGASPTPDGGLVADHLGDVGAPAALAARLAAAPGVVEHGLFGPELVSEVLVGRGDGVEKL